MRTVTRPYMVAILLDLKTEGIPRHRSGSLRWVGSVSFGFGFEFGFGFADSQYQASPPSESVCDRSLGNLQGVPHLSPRYSSPQPR